MKRFIIKLLASVLATVLMCSGIGGVSVYATESVQPRLDNFNRASFVFGVAEPGVAEVVVTYSAKEDVFTQAKLTVEIQKKILGVFWVPVDIGETNNNWVGYCSDVYGTFHKTFNVEGTGTYRAIMILEVSGTGGTTDVVEDIIESTY